MLKVRNPRYRGNPWRATRPCGHSQTLATGPASLLRPGTHPLGRQGPISLGVSPTLAAGGLLAQIWLNLILSRAKPGMPPHPLGTRYLHNTFTSSHTVQTSS
jgi:hypothetical protein